MLNRLLCLRVGDALQPHLCVREQTKRPRYCLNFEHEIMSTTFRADHTSEGRRMSHTAFIIARDMARKRPVRAASVPLQYSVALYECTCECEMSLCECGGLVLDTDYHRLPTRVALLQLPARPPRSAALLPVCWLGALPGSVGALSGASSDMQACLTPCYCCVLPLVSLAEAQRPQCSLWSPMMTRGCAAARGPLLYRIR